MSTPAPKPVTAVLSFYRAVQFQNYASAYLDLSARLRRQIPYKKFVEGLAPLRGEFLLRPRIPAVQANGSRAVVSLLLQRGKVLRQSDQVIEFNLVRSDGGWFIGTDPYNAFQVTPGGVGLEAPRSRGGSQRPPASR